MYHHCGFSRAESDHILANILYNWYFVGEVYINRWIEQWTHLYRVLINSQVHQNKCTDLKGSDCIAASAVMLGVITITCTCVSNKA